MRSQHVLLLLGLLFGIRQAAAQDLGTPESWAIGKYTVTLTHKSPENPDDVLSVSQGNQQIYRLKYDRIRLNPRRYFQDFAPDAADEDRQKPYAIGKDVIGLGAPTLLANGDVGGHHSQDYLTILVLGKTFRALPPLIGGRFKAVKGKKTLVLSSVDNRFLYWRATTYAESSAAPVILSFDPAAGRYLPDPALMRAPLPSPQELAEKTNAAHAAQALILTSKSPTDVPKSMTETILTLAYTGHLTEAHDFLNASWAGSAADRERYWSELTTCELPISQFWGTVAKMNGVPMAKPVEPCRP